MPRAPLTDTWGLFCSLPGHCEEGHLEKLSCIFHVLTEVFPLYVCIHLKVSSGKKQHSNVYRVMPPAVPALLDKRNSLRFFSVCGSGVSFWPQPGIFLHSRIRYQCHETLQHSNSTKEQLHLWSINWHKTCPQKKQKKCYRLPPFLLFFVLVSAK